MAMFIHQSIYRLRFTVPSLAKHGVRVCIYMLLLCFHSIVFAAQPISTSAQAMTTQQEKAIESIRNLHHFFQQWYNARFEKTEANFQPLQKALAHDFSFITTGGTVLNRQAVIDFVWQGYGQYKDQPIQIWTEGETVRTEGETLMLAWYEEHQQQAKKTQKMSSVVLRIPAEPNQAIQWLHVHETWIDDKH